jgi:hypothetical protein
MFVDLPSSPPPPLPHSVRCRNFVEVNKVEGEGGDRDVN